MKDLIPLIAEDCSCVGRHCEDQSVFFLHRETGWLFDMRTKNTTQSLQHTGKNEKRWLAMRNYDAKLPQFISTLISAASCETRRTAPVNYAGFKALANILKKRPKP